MKARKASDDAPVTFDSSFNAQQDSATGVVGMVEVIHEDFARLETETTQAEKDAAQEHKDFMQQSRVDNATKQATVDANGEKVARLSDELENRNRDLKGTQAELKAAQDYYEKLKPTCVTKPISYEERVQMREAEIQSLKEALTILEGSAANAAGAAGTVAGL